MSGCRHAASIGLTCLFTSAAALSIAPIVMPESYSWIANTTSESAAQGIPGAWVARFGFALFALGVLFVAASARAAWGRAPTAAHLVFAFAMLAAAGFSTRPWEAGAAFDRREDLLHSASATAIGFAFVVGVAALALARRPRPPLLDLLALLAAVAIPLAMAWRDDADGLLQRLMFGVAYAWYGREALRQRR